MEGYNFKQFYVPFLKPWLLQTIILQFLVVNAFNWSWIFKSHNLAKAEGSSPSFRS